MKTFVIFAGLMLGLMMTIPAPALARGSYHYHAPRASHSSPRTSAEHVNGYTRKNGTYVAPYVRTSPNGTKVDNWSSKPNVNPYTGKAGTKDPFAQPANTSNGGG